MRSTGSNLIRRIVKAANDKAAAKATRSSLVRRVIRGRGAAVVPSNASNLKHGEEVLYNRETTTVTASWLEIEQNSYAVRHLHKMTRHIKAPPRLEATIIFFIGVVLTIWQALRVINDTQPVLWHWILLISCLVLMFTAAFVAFAMPSVYSLEVDLANEKKPLSIPCITRIDLENLNDALLKAMDNYRGNPTQVYDSPTMEAPPSEPA